MKSISYKTSLLLTLTSTKQVSNLYALSVQPSPDGFKDSLQLNAVYLSKFIPATYSSC